jgi:hypothetical protein
MATSFAGSYTPGFFLMEIRLRSSVRTKFACSAVHCSAEMTPEMVRSVWQEIDYRWDVCRVTSGSHTEP